MNSAWKNKVIERFDAQALHYDDVNDVQADIAQSLSEDLPKNLHTPKILEIGCGTGTFTQYLFKAYPDAHFHITDASAAMVQCAREKLHSQHASLNIEWFVLDGENINSDARYDLIVSNMTFQWFENPESSVRKLQKLLNPDGQILYSVPSVQSFPEWRAALSKLSIPYGFDRNDDWPGIIREDKIHIEYANTLSFLRNVKKMGAHTALRGYKSISAGKLRKACKISDQENQGRVSWHILYGAI